MENYIIGYYDLNSENIEQEPIYKCIELKHGLKIDCTKFALDNIQADEYIKNNFILGIKDLEVVELIGICVICRMV
jgi:hypothetical protein